MAWLLVPGTDRAALRRVLRRIDEILGYPRAHAADEPGVKAGRSGLPYTDAALAVWLHDASGPVQLHGAIAVDVDGIAAALADRQIDAGAGRQRLRDIIAARGWAVRADLPDPNELERAPWTRLAHRDGEPGSVDGRPIPEGEE